MVSVNYAHKEISCKIVYYGPGLSGKTTNLQFIHQRTHPEKKGQLISLATDTDRTLYFDFLPMNLGKIRGFVTKFQLYTVPGQVYYNATRRLVLRGVDGIVFVADSHPDKMGENQESFANLRENLSTYGYDLDTLPLVLQYNKRDLRETVPVDRLNAVLNYRDVPAVEAVATDGVGVLETFKAIGKIVLERTSGRTGKGEDSPAHTREKKVLVQKHRIRAPHMEVRPQSLSTGGVGGPEKSQFRGEVVGMSSQSWPRARDGEEARIQPKPEQPRKKRFSFFRWFRRQRRR